MSDLKPSRVFALHYASHDDESAAPILSQVVLPLGFMASVPEVLLDRRGGLKPRPGVMRLLALPHGYRATVLEWWADPADPERRVAAYELDLGRQGCVTVPTVHCLPVANIDRIARVIGWQFDGAGAKFKAGGEVRPRSRIPRIK